METWKSIKNYEGLYKASSLGDVKSMHNRLNIHKEKGYRILKPVIQESGYGLITLCKNKIKNVLLAHRIIATAFIPNLENKPCINHKNGIKTDNRIDNLEWVTYSENTKHAVATGLCKFKTGKDHYNYGKTTSDKQKAVVSKLSKGNETRAKEYKILSPEGEVLTIFNMHKFCRNYTKTKLHASGMIRAAIGERKSHKGFKSLKHR